jgi:hypothetical protein
MINEIDTGFINFIRGFLHDKFGDDVVAVFGIGSSFMSDLGASDRDVVVILSTTEKCPKKEWTTALFEHHSYHDTEVWFLYGTLNDYLDKERFKITSFANWEWAIRGIKHASVLLWGEDIRPRLPEPEYDYQDILIRAAYHLEPTPEWKFKKAEERGDIIDEKMRFTKAVFKFGFFLTAVDYPEANVFDKQGVYNLLKSSRDMDLVGEDIVEFYEIALAYRSGEDIPRFEECRKAFMKAMVRETIGATKNTWGSIREIFLKGFRYPFSGIVEYIDRNGWRED